MTRWFEDVEIDEVYELGSHVFTAEEITRFATLYDPQYFHIDPEAARHSHFGGPIASGWHTVCVGHRKMVDALDAEADRLRALGEEPGIPGPSPGVNSMQFKAPVRPGDEVNYRLKVKSKRNSNSLPGWGVMLSHLEARNQHGELVYEAELASFSKRRDYKPTTGQRIAEALTQIPGLAKLARALR